MIHPFISALPWLLVCAVIALRIRFPRPLPDLRTDGTDLSRPDDAADGSADGTRRGAAAEGELPFVSVVVPARNEEDVIGACVRSLASSAYPAFEVIVVDDRSEDRTRAIARRVEAGRARRLLVLDGEPLPEGWLGKPWACWQGYRESGGDIVLFTDADTRHGPDLLERSVRALDEDGVDAVSVAGRQIMETWWEKLVLPQVFTLIAVRFPDVRRPIEPGRCRDAVASGQYILVRRDAYAAVDGHRGVRSAVVEDLELARALCRSGRRLSLREAETALATRMYRSFPHMLEGWTKNLAIGSLESLPPRVRGWALPAGFVGGVALWLVPPTVLAAGVLGWVGVSVTVWAATVFAGSALFWGAVSVRMGLNGAYGLLYPIGSAVTSAIFARSALRGRRRVEWKGRVYELEEG